LPGRLGAPGASLRSRARRVAAIAALVAAAATLTVAPSAGASTAAPSTVDPAALAVTQIDWPWYSVETYYLGLLNCTRTGGWVQTDGTCRGYGSGHYTAYVAPLRLSPLISDYVSRPYARLLAIRNLCTHTADHDPGFRFRRVGLTHWTWAENIGCGWGYPSEKAAVLANHLAFQRERWTNGGHWQNIKSTRYTLVGVAVWRSAAKTRLVTDFYR
jgi:hypothetical protein